MVVNDLDVISNLTSLENLLVKNNTNTSTYDISDGTNIRIKTFKKGVVGMHERVPIPNTMYPAIFTEISVGNEEFAQIGNSANRNIDLNFDIVIVTNYGMGAQTNAWDNVESSDLELIRVAQNIGNLLRANISLSSTVLDSNIESTEYSTVLKDTKTYNGVATMRVVASLLST